MSTLLSRVTTADAQLRALSSALDALATARAALVDAGLYPLAVDVGVIEGDALVQRGLLTCEHAAAELALNAYRARAMGEDCPACLGRGVRPDAHAECPACEGTGEHVAAPGEAVPA